MASGSFLSEEKRAMAKAIIQRGILGLEDVQEDFEKIRQRQELISLEEGKISVDELIDRINNGPGGDRRQQ